jgi:simple sugar transport system permease protein
MPHRSWRDALRFPALRFRRRRHAMRVRIEPRRTIPRWLPWLTPVLAVGATVIASALIFSAISPKPALSLYAFFISPLLSADGLTELALKAGPLAMMAVGLAAGFRANVWNIGAEGQLTMGAIAGGGVALAFWGQDGFWILPLMCLSGIAGGMAWAAIPAFLRTRLGVNEILVSLMLTYVAGLALTALVFGPWKDPEGFNFPQSRMFSDSETIPPLITGTGDRLHHPRARLGGDALFDHRLPDPRRRPRAGRGALCRVFRQPHRLAGAAGHRRPRRPCRGV